MNRMIFLALCLFGLSSAALWADSLTLNRDAAVELALSSNPDFKVEGISLETAERADRNAWNNLLPNISAGAGLTGSSNLFGAAPNSMAWKFTGSVDMSLPLNASLGYTIKGLQLAYESQEISYESARITLISSVEKEFYYLLAVEKNLGIEKANIDLAQERYEQTRTRYDAGLASELDMLQAQVTAANLEPTYLQTVADYEARVRDFLIILGLDPETELALEGSLETPAASFDTEELISRYMSNRPDIQAGQKALESAKNSKSETIAAERTPSLGLSAGWSTQVNDAFDSSSWDYSTWSDGASVSLNLNIPLDGYVPGSSSSVKIKSKEDEIQKASISLAKTTEEARTEIINLVAQLETSAANMELSELNVELAQKSFELSEESYARGTLQRLDVEDAQQSYLEAVQQSLVSRYEYLAGLINLRTALGLDSLEELI